MKGGAAGEAADAGRAAEEAEEAPEELIVAKILAAARQPRGAAASRVLLRDLV
jgi:hypothetical protein